MSAKRRKTMTKRFRFYKHLKKLVITSAITKENIKGSPPQPAGSEAQGPGTGLTQSDQTDAMLHEKTMTLTVGHL